MRTRGQRRGRRARDQVREPSLLSASQMLGLSVFAVILCLALWMAFAPRSDTVGFESPQPVETARLSEPQQGMGDVTSQPVQIKRRESSASNRGISFRRCGRVRTNCVVDGDTFWYQGVKIRVADVDAPEIGKPRCVREHQLGLLATDNLVEFLNGGEFELLRPAGLRQDRYGRELYVLMRGGRSFGDDLVRVGLAHTWIGYKQSWCG